MFILILFNLNMFVCLFFLQWSTICADIFINFDVHNRQSFWWDLVASFSQIIPDVIFYVLPEHRFTSYWHGFWRPSPSAMMFCVHLINSGMGDYRINYRGESVNLVWIFLFILMLSQSFFFLKNGEYFVILKKNHN